MFLLYDQDIIYHRIEGFEPLVAQWEKRTHPAQIRLNKYLTWLTGEIRPQLNDRDDLFLHLEIDVQDPAKLLHQYDLENYLTPLFGKKWLNPSSFVLVSARKKVGGGNSIEIGQVRWRTNAFENDWSRFSCSPGAGSSKPEWKERIRVSLASTNPDFIPTGPAEVHLAWRCSPNRNWVNLWKPTGDAMGPVLGYTSLVNLYHPRDDRIVHLSMHKTIDPRIGYDVQVGMWWRTT